MRKPSCTHGPFETRSSPTDTKKHLTVNKTDAELTHEEIRTSTKRNKRNGAPTIAESRPPQRLSTRIAGYALGLNCLAAGIVLNTRTGLGVAAFTSAAYAFSSISCQNFGAATALFYLLLAIAEAAMLHRLEPAVLLQIPLSFVFGFVIDFYDALIPAWNLTTFEQGILLLIAILFTPISVTLSVRVYFVVAPPDGMVQTISSVSGREYGWMKNAFDIAMVCVTLGPCLGTRSPLYGLGIGTILSAVLNGRLIHTFSQALDRTARRCLARKAHAL
jgi:uncharacterized membrane protein YczE